MRKPKKGPEQARPEDQEWALHWRPGWGTSFALSWQEPLERRLLLAGDVTVLASGGSSSIVGDAQDNAIAIDRIGLPADQFRVTATDGGTLDVIDNGNSLAVAPTIKGFETIN